MHACIHACIHACTYTYMHTYIHACMHAYIHVHGDRYVVLADCEAVPTSVGGGGAYLLEAKVKIEFWNEGWEEKSGEEADFCKVCRCMCLRACVHRTM